MMACGRTRDAMFCLFLLVLAAPSIADQTTSEVPLVIQPENIFDPFHHQQLYMLDPLPPIDITNTNKSDPDRQRLGELDELPEEEFSAPPLVVARISSLPANIDDSPTQAVLRAERNLIRERARAADRMFARGDTDGAIKLMDATERLMQNPELRVMALNRVAAYYFRLQKYDKTVVYARQAWELAPDDLISACNLSATLLSVGEVDEALNILLRIYGQVYDRPQLAFSMHFNLACAYSLKHETTKALQNLALAARADPVATFTTMGDPHLDFVRDRSEFIRLREALVAMMKPGAQRLRP